MEIVAKHRWKLICHYFFPIPTKNWRETLWKKMRRCYQQSIPLIILCIDRLCYDKLFISTKNKVANSVNDGPVNVVIFSFLPAISLTEHYHRFLTWIYSIPFSLPTPHTLTDDIPLPMVCHDAPHLQRSISSAVTS